MRRRVKTLLAAIAVAVPIAVPMSATAEESEDSYAVPGLEKPVSMTVDKWGVPHISASSTGDLFQAQGFSAARDRLFQMDTWRRSGLGKLSEVLGKSYVEQDRASRLFLYRGDMDREWAGYGPEAKEAATRFAAGVNAYVDWLEKNPDAMPEEFRKLGYQPARWKPQDVVRIRTHGLVSNLTKEVGRAKLMCLGGPDAGRYLSKLEPKHKPRVPDGLDLCSLPDDVLDTYNLATADVAFENGRMRKEPEDVRALREATSGSNAWAVAPQRTATGRPILAGDPHRVNHAVPANRYITHLSAPGLNIIGAGEPWNPGVSMGHNGNIAFGLTNLAADQSDLYVYDLKPGDPTKYRYRGRWVPMRTVQEDIPVAGGDAQTSSLSFTKHGPVIKVDRAKNKAYAVRTVWTQPGTSAYLGSLNFQKAKSFGAFTKAMRKWGAPGSNLVYSDRKGDIGWVPGALAPKRAGKGYDGLLPVPGDGRYEWTGFRNSGDFPREHNPKAGFVSSANEYNFPRGSRPTGYEWSERYRKDRIDEVLSQQSDTSIKDTTRLQNDVKSLAATEVLPYLKRLESSDPTARKALEVLRGYDGVASKDSAGAVLFETWITNALFPAWAEAMLPKEAAQHLTQGNFIQDFRVIADSFAEPEEWFGKGGAQARDKLILDTLPAAYEEVSGYLGADPGQWSWGAAQIHLFQHPLGGPNVGPTPMDGTYHTVRRSTYLPSIFPRIQIVGATFKMALDVGSWDNSRAINAPGQSGDERSPHYADLAGKWGAGEYFPLLYSESAIAKNARTTITLNPA
ncbi:penicillin acylase family protein [Streptomyces boncukensis]|uniref:Penicillin acylase family protein n=1 Tax=Streptomyces boncukensis TaxID=2711219 RepID=A0A6G4X436_9ACTN|nr:penicillin acylase family protein [Streptomyces boncukensis]NGO71431.1 penicillin acylase family protein [Streptomyces boncukensis]